MTALSKHGFIHEDMRLRRSKEFEHKREIETNLFWAEYCIWSYSLEAQYAATEAERVSAISDIKRRMKDRRRFQSELEEES